MKYRYLGKTGVKVSELALGCMTFEHAYVRDMTKQNAFDILDSYVSEGGNFFDMADNYPGVEELFGDWLQTRNDRDQFVIASKLRFPSSKGGVNDVGLSRKHIVDTVDSALKKTGAGYIDLYQMHMFDEFTPLEDSMDVFGDLIRAGKIRYIGGSNFDGRHVAKAAAYSRFLRLPRLQSYQMQYNLLTRTAEWEVIPAALEAGSSINAWSPLGAGWLSGKYSRDSAPPAGSRMGKVIHNMDEWEKLKDSDINAQFPHARDIRQARHNAGLENEAKNDRRWLIIDSVKNIALKYNATPSQVALAWLLRQKAVCSAVIGVSRLPQLNENLAAMDLVIDEADLNWLNDVSEPGKVYPYDFIAEYGQWR